jgi:hypothetical protein
VINSNQVSERLQNVESLNLQNLVNVFALFDPRLLNYFEFLAFKNWENLQRVV